MTTYAKNLDEYKSIGTHWVALYVNGDYASAFYDAIYFASLTVKQIKKKKKIHRKRNKSLRFHNV